MLIFLGGFNVAHAGLEINEIMYAPENGSNYEWVEIFNNSSKSVDLNSHRFFHGENSSPISLKVGNSAILEPSKYAIIARSMSDYSWLNTSSPIFSSTSLSLSDDSSKYNTYIAISDADKNILDDITYDTSKGGSKISKTSLSKINGDWQGSKPTPGERNIEEVESSTEESESSNDSNSNNISNSVSSDNSTVLKYKPEVYKITTKIISPKVVTATLPFLISSLTTTNKKETLAVGKYVWNFGDGTSAEMQSQKEFEHIYNYPGEYVMSLSFFDNHFNKLPDATSRLIIKVISPDIIISSVGQDLDSFVEFENKADSEIDISGFIIKGVSHNFVIPNGTIILSNHKLIFSAKTTGFNHYDISLITVTNSAGEFIAKYPIIKEPLVSKNKISNSISSFVSKFSSDDKIDDNSDISSSSVINLNDLAASAGNIRTPEVSKLAYSLLGLVGIIIIGGAVVYITRKKTIAEVPDYLEKEISAEDIKIIE